LEQTRFFSLVLPMRKVVNRQDFSHWYSR